MVHLENIHKRYRIFTREVHALRGISMDINAGEFVFVVGPSGSGKSTLLHIVGALDRPDSGKVFVDGTDLCAMRDSDLSSFRRHKVGFIFQSFNLIPNLTCVDNVLIPFMPEGMREEHRKRAISILEMIGLGERLDHRPSQLSGGEQQRVAIARALVKNPVLILADEPTGELDTVTGSEIFAQLRRINQEQGTTCIVVTHDTSYITNDNRVFRIRDGKLEFGSSGHLLSRTSA